MPDFEFIDYVRSVNLDITTFPSSSSSSEYEYEDEDDDEHKEDNATGGDTAPDSSFLREDDDGNITQEYVEYENFVNSCNDPLEEEQNVVTHSDIIDAICLRYAAPPCEEKNGQRSWLNPRWPINSRWRPIPGKLDHIYGLYHDDKWVIISDSSFDIKVFDIVSLQVQGVLHGHTGPVRKFIAVGRDCIISCADDRTIRVWDITTLKCKHILEGHNREVTCMCVIYPEDEKTADPPLPYPLLLSGSADGRINVWHLPTLSDRTNELFYETTFVAHERSAVRHLAAQGYTAVSAADNGTISVFNMYRRAHLTLLRGHYTKIRSLSFRPDGYFVTTSERQIRCWGLHSDLLHNFSEHRGIIWSMDAEGPWVVSGDIHGQIIVWNTRTGGVEHRLVEPCRRLATVVQLSGGLLLTAAGTNMCMWDVSTGVCLRTLINDAQTVVQASVRGDRCACVVNHGHGYDIEVFELQSAVEES